METPEGSSWFANSEVTAALEEHFLPAYLAKARWFPRNSAKRIKPKIIARLPFSGNATVFIVIETDHHAHYLLPLTADWSVDAGPELEKSIVAPLRQGEREGLLRDVAADPAFIQKLLDHLRREVSIAGSGWRLDFKPTTKLGSRPPRATARVRAIQGEQSNSTALVDQDYVVKLYRHIEPGQNPEIEMGYFLTEATNFTHTPALLGHVEATYDSASYALGIVHAFVPNHGDAWTWSVDRLSIYLDAMAEGSEERDKALTTRRDYLQWVRHLGCRVAEMHCALASRDDVAAFKPEPINERDLDFWIGDLVERAARIFNRLEETPLDANDRPLVERLLRVRSALSGYAAHLISHTHGPCKIRHHGDLHLGQVLVAGEDAVIIDFEGEPSRPLADRRRKAPAARDVAGVLRSLDYAAMALGQQRQKSEKLTPSALRALHAWRDQSTDGFLSAYQEAMGPSALWPARSDDAKAMLNFFLLEKAFYEVEYELSYRPAWISVPLQGVLRVLEEGGVT
ncbi:putative maltokinase [Bradyrhizobium sp. AZCC 1578]|uniref:putative maltokinase n=1 Tax=Bradyrhizobium sp. AZCC 1578 TaxID=3117027 RepID=UPI002FEE98EC